jgi:cytochrome oxidase Cu insertion factor (SCO1/SenC/PrrC family)
MNLLSNPGKWRWLGSALVVALLAIPTAQPVAAEEDLFRELRLVRFSKPVPTPDFTLQDLNGKPVKMSDFQGKVVLLNFWTTW